MRTLKEKTAGGQPIHDFGNKKCELHPFTPNDGPKNAEVKRLAAEEQQRQLAALDEAKRIAAEEERKRITVEEEAKRLAAEDQAKKVAAEEQAKRIAAEENAKKKPGAQSPPRKIATNTSQQVDFDAEATKAARILGCLPSEVKVIGADGGNIQYRVTCDGSKALLLSCDSSGLCLPKKQK